MVAPSQPTRSATMRGGRAAGGGKLVAAAHARPWRSWDACCSGKTCSWSTRDPAPAGQPPAPPPISSTFRTKVRESQPYCITAAPSAADLRPSVGRATAGRPRARPVPPPKAWAARWPCFRYSSITRSRGRPRPRARLARSGLPASTTLTVDRGRRTSASAEGVDHSRRGRSVQLGRFTRFVAICFPSRWSYPTISSDAATSTARAPRSARITAASTSLR